MKFMKYTILSALLFFSLISCKKNNQEYTPIKIDCTLTKNIDSARQLITGIWDWLEEQRIDQRQQKFVFLTPANQGYSLKMIFQNDTVTFFKNNNIEIIYTYSIVPLKVISGTSYPEDEDPVIVFYNIPTGIRDAHVPFKICTNFLLMQYQFVTSVDGQQIWEKQ